MRYNSVCRNKLLLEVLWYVFQYFLLISSSPVSLSVSVRLKSTYHLFYVFWQMQPYELGYNFLIH